MRGKKITPKQKQDMLDMKTQGMSVSNIAKNIGLSKQAVYKYTTNLNRPVHYTGMNAADYAYIKQIAKDKNLTLCKALHLVIAAARKPLLSRIFGGL